MGPCGRVICMKGFLPDSLSSARQLYERSKVLVHTAFRTGR